MPRDVPDPLPAETLSAMWFSLHSDERFGVRSNELHYFRALAVAIDDDLSSLLLLKKLKLAEEFRSIEMPDDIIALNSSFEFSVDGRQRQRGRLVHRSLHELPDAISANSRVGIGLLGLRTGQQILWPDEHDRMRRLEVLSVKRVIARLRPQLHRSLSS